MKKIPLTNGFDHEKILGFISIHEKLIDQISSGLEKGVLYFAPSFIDKGNGEIELLEISIIAHSNIPTNQLKKTGGTKNGMENLQCGGSTCERTCGRNHDEDR